ncbi:hypothetical protein DRN74_06675 [Candidatus Micrarchaeota archaeon]|nr:MAG: hypothetical protein DRN74_06675 [Candidatus Micrarchaeota archaeon]
MRSIEGQKEGAVTMENGPAEMYAQRPVQGLVTKLGGPPRNGSRNTKNEDLPPKAVCRYPKGEEGEPCRH